MASYSSVSRLSTRCLSRYPLVRNSSLVGGVRNASTHSQESLPLLPSVAQLLHEHNIPPSEIPKIPATGPRGRLLKGDVLSYLGAIASDYPSTLSSRISRFAHLDLSNIKLAPPPAPPAPAPAEQQSIQEVEEAASVPEDVKVSLPVSFTNLLNLQDRVENGIGVSIPLSTLINRAAHLANIDLPLPRDTYVSASQRLDSLYEQILGTRPTTPVRLTSTGSYFPELETQLESLSRPARTITAQEDIIDILSGKASARPRRVESAPAVSADEVPVLSVTVSAGEKARAEEFLRRVRSYVEEKPDSLLLI
ncbi:hypothetical protein VTO42DRAFT_858 [Malbranchea cinnamomea]